MRKTEFGSKHFMMLDDFLIFMTGGPINSHIHALYIIISLLIKYLRKFQQMQTHPGSTNMEAQTTKFPLDGEALARLWMISTPAKVYDHIVTVVTFIGMHVNHMIENVHSSS